MGFKRIIFFRKLLFLGIVFYSHQSIADSHAISFVFSSEDIFLHDEKIPLVKLFDTFFEKKLNLWRKWDNFDLIRIQDGNIQHLIPIALLELRNTYFHKKNDFKYTSEFLKFGDIYVPNMLHIAQAENSLSFEIGEQLKLWLQDFPSSLAVPPKSSSDFVKLGYFFSQYPQASIKSLFSQVELEYYKSSYSAFMTGLNRMSSIAH